MDIEESANASANQVNSVRIAPALSAEKTNAGATFAILLFLCAFSFLFVQVITPHGPATSPDSLSYLEMAGSIRAGQGAAVPVRTLEAYGTEAVTKTTLWPPLYPTLLAAVEAQPPDLGGYQLISSLCLCLLLVFVFLTLREVVQPLVASLPVLLICLTIPILLDYSFIWSETLFLTFSAAIHWALIKFHWSDNEGAVSRRAYLLILAVLAATSFYTRYTGIIFFFVLVYAFLISRHRAVDRGYFMAAAVILIAPSAYLLVRNYEISGSITGGPRAISELSGLDIYNHVVDTLAIVFPLSAGVWLCCCLLAAFFVFVLEFAKPAEVVVVEPAVKRDIVIRSAVFLALLYFAAILLMRYFRDFDTIGVRLLSPAFLPFWSLLCALIFVGHRQRIVRLALRLIASSTVLALCWQGATFYGHIRENVHEIAVTQYPYRRDHVHLNYTEARNFGELSSLLKWNVAKPGIIASSRPSVLAFVTDLPSVEMPQDYGNEFLVRLAAAANPHFASLFFVRESEHDYFLELVEDSPERFEAFPTSEGVLVILYGWRG